MNRVSTSLLTWLPGGGSLAGSGKATGGENSAVFTGFLPVFRPGYLEADPWPVQVRQQEERTQLYEQGFYHSFDLATGGGSLAGSGKATGEENSAV